MASPSTGLADDDVFYFGNAPGESGDSVRHTFVNAFDFAGPRDNPLSNPPGADIDSRFDFNRDNRIDGADLAIARDNTTDIRTALEFISVPATPPRVVDLVIAERIQATRMPDGKADDPEPQNVREAALLELMDSAVPVSIEQYSDRPLATNYPDEQMLDEMLFDLLDQESAD